MGKPSSSSGRYPAGIDDIGVAALKGPKLVLTDAERQRLDESADAEFYATPRMMQHVDDDFRAALSRVLSSVLPAGASVLELCASHSSHLPDELQPRLMVGQGMNAQELAANPALHQWFVQDLNLQPLLLEQLDSSFEAVLCVNGLQYLTQPETVVAEASRVLRPGGVIVIAYGPHCFPEKAWAGWLSRSMPERSQLLTRILQANGFEKPMVLNAAAVDASSAPGSAQAGEGAAGQAPQAAALSCEMAVLVAAKPRFWTAGAAEADTTGAVPMRPDNVDAWFTKPGLTGLQEAAQGHGSSPQESTAGRVSSSAASPSAAPAHGDVAGAGAVVSERLLEQWHAAYTSLVEDAVDLGIPRSVVPSVRPDAPPAELQEAVQHLQAMMASFLSAGL